MSGQHFAVKNAIVLLGYRRRGSPAIIFQIAPPDQNRFILGLQADLPVPERAATGIILLNQGQVYSAEDGLAVLSHWDVAVIVFGLDEGLDVVPGLSVFGVEPDLKGGAELDPLVTVLPLFLIDSNRIVVGK